MLILEIIFRIEVGAELALIFLEGIYLMQRTMMLNKNFTLDQINHLIDTGHIFVAPLGLNSTAYIVINHKPFMVVVTDVSMFAIQLSGSWYAWDELEKMGGVYASEFDALKAVANGV